MKLGFNKKSNLKPKTLEYEIKPFITTETIRHYSQIQISSLIRFCVMINSHRDANRLNLNVKKDAPNNIRKWYYKGFKKIVFFFVNELERMFARADHYIKSMECFIKQAA